MITQQFNATNELKKIRQRKFIKRRKAYQYSRLAKLRAELVAMRRLGASYRELMLWLRQTKRIKTTHTTIMRYLEKLPELKENNDAKFSQREETSAPCSKN